MEQRLCTPEYALEAPVSHKEDGGETLLKDFLAVESAPADEQLADAESQDILKEKLREFAKDLGDRDKKIFMERLLAELPVTLQDIADEYGITRERVRQIEARLVEKLKGFLKDQGIDAAYIEK